MELLHLCPKCKNQVSPTDYFCPNCGTKLRDKPPATTVMAQLGVYALSFFLPPFGIIPAVKYLRQPDKKSKIIGIISMIITVIVTVASVFVVIGYFNYVNTLVNQEFAPLNMY